MSEYKVELKRFDDLTETQQKAASNNGSGKEYANYLHVTQNGRTLLLESDAMEPEDCRFSRDLSWIKVALEQAYQAGKSSGEPGGEWQSIETAPKDVLILLANRRWQQPVVLGYFDAGYGEWTAMGVGLVPDPQLWMPAPTLPLTKSGDTP